MRRRPGHAPVGNVTAEDIWRVFASTFEVLRVWQMVRKVPQRLT
ncbi:hypothetical protein SAMN05444695_110126 [Rhodococcus triatomae]|uniref:Uncharacterized protein n=1 Tax=Rhodococcus triatomae TaxID=300028 RepID=A0A1G8MYR9_9NOCA|nr:hypothetical protein SAMN05444695_110126 [Rhodococcus triatomae]